MKFSDFLFRSKVSFFFSYFNLFLVEGFGFVLGFGDIFWSRGVDLNRALSKKDPFLGFGITAFSIKVNVD